MIGVTTGTVRELDQQIIGSAAVSYFGTLGHRVVEALCELRAKLDAHLRVAISVGRLVVGNEVVSRDAAICVVLGIVKAGHLAAALCVEAYVYLEFRRVVRERLARGIAIGIA